MPGSTNEKAMRTKLEAWRHLHKDNKIIHTVNDSFMSKTELLRKPAEEVFKTWDVISCSLINIRKIRKEAHEADELTQWESTERSTGLFFDIGFILSVPPQNILGTHSHDVWFPNHAGTKNRNTWALADAIFSGRGKDGGSHAWPAKSGKTYNQIRTPDDILRHSDTGRHNEILVIGKKDINIYSGYRPTENIRVTGIIAAPKYQTGHRMFARELDRELSEKLRKFRKLNPKLEVIEI